MMTLILVLNTSMLLLNAAVTSIQSMMIMRVVREERDQR